MRFDRFKPALQKFGCLTILGWTLIIASLGMYSLREHWRSAIRNAEEEARNHFRLNLQYREWASEMGGVYAPTGKIAPNPFLTVPNRDITDNHGRQLTLVNPAYMTRMVFGRYTSSSDPVLNKITSLKPLNPANAPDEWERQNLLAFERSEYAERSEVTTIGGKPYLRFISMFVTEQSCLRCHVQQGYHPGDVRGAIVVSVPLSRRLALQAEHRLVTAGRYSFLWLLGTAAIAVSSRRRFMFTQQLRTSEEKFRALFEQSLDAVFFTSPDGTVFSANRAACVMFGMTELELRSAGRAGVLNPADGRWQAALEERDRTGRAWAEGTCIRKNGDVFPVELTSVVTMYEPRRSFVIMRDITGRKQAEEELKSMARRLRLATDSAHLAVWDWNVRDNAMLWDDRMYEMYGIEKDKVPLRVEMWVNSLHPDDRERATGECQAALRGEKDFDTVFRICRPDGTVRHIKANGLVIRGADGSAEQMIGVNADVTDQVVAQAEKAILEGQLLQAQKMESIGRLAGGVAHDFNNMLQVILAQAQLALIDMSATDPLHENLVEIRNAAARSADLTRQLMAFARKQTVARRLLDLNRTVTGMLKMLQRLLGEDIHLRWHPAPDLWQVRMDPSQVDQILANLCVNARDAITDTGKITIETGNATIDEEYCRHNPAFRPGDYVRVTVSDNGRGMSKETMSHIFEPFFTTKEYGAGIGLGLATVYGIVKQNEGFINVYSEPGMGTTFAIYLPRHANAAAQAVPSCAEEPVRGGKETILLVEDEASILKISTTLLTMQGYCVIPVNTPADAIRAAGEGTAIDLVITDVVMPGMNGHDLVDKLQALHPQLKCLYMSGYTADVIAHHGVLDEGVHFIQKPFSLPALAAKVREALGDGNASG